ncbi:MAG: hypothetical protein V4695_01430 [Pseudomonadota bacterium]
MKTSKFVRLGNPSVLSKETKVLGSTAGRWDAALKGNWKQSMAVLKTRVSEVEAERKRNPASCALPKQSGDLASVASHTRRPQ